MYFVQMFVCVILLVRVVFTHDLDGELAVDRNMTVSNETATAYNFGVLMGIINPEKYALESFEQDQPTFKKLYEEFVSYMGPMNYQKWLVMNNFGVLADTKESIFDKKISERSEDPKQKFLDLVDVGDILITSRSNSGLIGHAAIMINNQSVLEMRGGRKWKEGIDDNNRYIAKKLWYDDNWDEMVTVYRCPDRVKASASAKWIFRQYYNPECVNIKEIFVTYKITPNFTSMNPSYSSKLVLQAYYYGTTDVIMEDVPSLSVIVPIYIPAYFLAPYQLKRIGKFRFI